MAQDLPVLLVGAGLILLGFAMLTAVVAVGVAVLRSASWYGAAHRFGGRRLCHVHGSVIARPSHTRGKST